MTCSGMQLAHKNHDSNDPINLCMTRPIHPILKKVKSYKENEQTN